ncbi:cytochrome P450 [Lanmaoa asiatica]|nr:cytochrome P450 [Lanmaoa asiatica]
MSLDALFSTSRTVWDVLDTFLTHLRPYRWYAFDAAVVCTAIWTLLRRLRSSREKHRTTQLRGPPSESFLYGVGKRIRDAENSGPMYEAWAQEYGPVYAVPSTLGNERIVLCDHKAIAHFYSKESWTYIQTPLTKRSFAELYGKGLLWAHGEDHKRQRKSLMPAFSMAAIRQLTSIFYDSVYKAKGAWEVLIEANGEDSAIIEVQSWCVSLDTIGLACFSHDFGALEGKHASVTDVLDTFSASPGRSTALNKGLLLLAQAFPFLTRVPTPRTRLVQKLNAAMEEISNVLLGRTQKELEIGVVGGKEERSIIGLLIKGTHGDSEFRLTKEEVIAQVNASCRMRRSVEYVILADEIWALLELSRNPDIQSKLRNELLEHGTDPTYEQLTNGLPYLDAIIHEILRLHLSSRLRAWYVPTGFSQHRPHHLSCVLFTALSSLGSWLSRWLEDAHGQNGIPAKAKEIQGHRHLLTFVDGPRTCLGKNFAVTDLKAVLSVLVKNFVFEMRDGVDSKIEIGRGVFPRPKIAGEVGCKLPLYQ